MREFADTLKSTAFSQFIDLISEGEIEGLVDGLKSIYLDKVPILNPDGTPNFPDASGVNNSVGVQWRYGTNDQDYMSGFADVEYETGVGVQIKAAVPVVRTITNTNIDAVRVRISIPQLTVQDTQSGDLGGTRVSISISLQSNGSGFVEKFVDNFLGKTTSKYEKSYRVELTGDPPWDIKLSRLTPDSTTSNLQNSTVWESFTEIEDIKLSYPNSAVVGIRMDSTQFESVPGRGYDIRGLKIRVPSNYDAFAKKYFGVWDGTYIQSWTDNPVWIFFSLLTHKRYGLGQFIADESINKWKLYEISQYCDELISDGKGGLEPRFSCNFYLQTRQDCYKVLQDLASSFRSMIFWSQGEVSLAQDAPSDAVFIFNTSNVADGVFTYQGTSQKTRFNVCHVTWNDPEDFYNQKVESIQEDESIAKFGIIESEVVAIGCTSQSQAHRVGRWMLYTNKFETETVNFQTGLEGAVVLPGDVIKISDPVRAGKRLGGRIRNSSTLSSVEIDSPVDLAGSLILSVSAEAGKIEDSKVDHILGQTVYLADPLSAVPPEGSLWVLSSTDVELQTFRVVGVTEEKGVFSVTALSHNPSKYDYIEQDLVLEIKNISSLQNTISSPTDLIVTENLYSVQGDVRLKVNISWTPVNGATHYTIQYQRDNENRQTLDDSSSPSSEILNAQPGFYTIIVTAVNTLGIKSDSAIATKTVIGKALPPVNVSGFSLVPMANIAYLSWTQAPDLDVLIGGSVRIRHTPDLASPEWKDSIDIVPALAGSANRAQAPLLNGTYMAKFIDSTGIASVMEATIQTTLPQALSLNVVSTITESPLFLGVMNTMQLNPDLSGIMLSAGLLIDDVGPIDLEASIDYAGGVAASGTYDFQNTVDLSQIFTSRCTATISAQAIDVTDRIDERTDPIDLWPDLDGAYIGDVNASLFLRTTTDDPLSGGAVWGPWKNFFVQDYTARGYQFRLVATSGSVAHNILITSLSVTIDMPDRTINLNNVLTGTSTAYHVSFLEPFYATPAVGITAYNMNTGDFFSIANKTRTGFDITFFNSSGTKVSRNFDMIAKGFGRAVG